MYEQAVKETIEQGYIRPVYLDRDVAGMRAFHPEFRMFMQQAGGELRMVSLNDWQAMLERGRQRNPQGAPGEVTWQLTVLDEANDVGTAKVELFRDGKQLYTDYLSLYHFPQGWLVVAKVFHFHRKIGQEAGLITASLLPDPANDGVPNIIDLACQ